MLYCPNYTCQTPNPESYKFCQKCRTPLPHHYLWAVGDGAASFRPEETLVNRYLCKGSRIFLDTKPGLYPANPTEIPADFAAYLRLSPYQLHIPQVYEVLVSSSSEARLLLLDQAALLLPGTLNMPDPEDEPDFEPRLLPALVDNWFQETALRQLHYLWQIAQLWQPLASQQVASSLLAPELLRVEGSLIRLLELRSDQGESFNLGQLGQLWLQWLPTAKAEISNPLAQICQDLTQGSLRNAEQLIQRLDELLVQVGRSPQRQIQLTTATDKGPSRQRNEDACFPASGTVSTQQSGEKPILLIVCDGIGGHQGGDVASNLAIEAVRQHVQSLSLEDLDPPNLITHLEQAVCIANDLISQRNDSERRMERQRMGTTLVMGLIRAHELYITHVGDSRAYRISRWSCRQVTQDDDVASREVRLGYSPYREALQQPGAGSLVQALGMGASTMLRPTVQRFILDEDSIFLLCSDGLSDNDRIEEIWDTVLLPLLERKRTLVAVRDDLIDIANTRNGHDNVTVGLFTIQVTDPQIPTTNQMGQSQLSTSASTKVVAPTQPPSPLKGEGAASEENLPGTSRKIQLLPMPRATKTLFPLLAMLMLGVGMGGILLYSLSLSFRQWVDAWVGFPTTTAVESEPNESASSSGPLIPLPTLNVGAFAQVQSETATNSTVASSSLVLVSQPVSSSSSAVGTLANDSVIAVLQKKVVVQQESWVQIRLCSTASPSLSTTIPNSASPGTLPRSPLPSPPEESRAAPAEPSQKPPSVIPSSRETVLRPLQPGQDGWIQERVLSSLVIPKPNPTSQERGACLSSPPTLRQDPASDVS